MSETSTSEQDKRDGARAMRMRRRSHAFLAKADRQDRCLRGGRETLSPPGRATGGCRRAEIQKLGHRLILNDLLEELGVIRHNPRRLDRLLVKELLSTADAPAAMCTGRVSS